MTTSALRIEHDSMGPVEIPAEALYGPQTQRALNNFTISAEPMRWEFIEAVIIIKRAAAKTNTALGLLNSSQGQAISNACTALLTGMHKSHFPVPVFQTGSGTSTNMNVNEVIAHLAGELGEPVNANDQVNLGQSSNDVIPTAIHISTCLELTRRLKPAVIELADTIRHQAATYGGIIKTGRTHLMDALPIRLQAEFEAWAIQLDESVERIDDCLTRLSRLPLGGTAIGSGVNCHPQFAAMAIKELGIETGLAFSAASSPYKGISAMDSCLEASAHLKTMAVSLMKIANDLRWMNSGPLAGLGEIMLPSLQPGSSIMPAKVNPIIPEAVMMAAAQVIGLDAAITIGAQMGNFQLNTMLPLIGTNLLQQISLLAGCCDSLKDKVFAGLKINEERCSEALARNPILATALNPRIGYLKAAELAKIAARENRTILDVATEHTDITEDELAKLLDPKNLADGGKASG